MVPSLPTFTNRGGKKVATGSGNGPTPMIVFMILRMLDVSMSIDGCIIHRLCPITTFTGI